MTEAALLTGLLEATNEPYAIAKIAGIKLCESYNRQWGTGTAMREFLHVDDMAAASLHVLGLSTEAYQSHTAPMLSHVNVGTGVDVTIKELAETIQAVVGFTGEIVWDSTKPDGTPRKLMSVEKLKALGWQASINLKDGLADTYQWFLKNQDAFRAQ